VYRDPVGAEKMPRDGTAPRSNPNANMGIMSVAAAAREQEGPMSRHSRHVSVLAGAVCLIGTSLALAQEARPNFAPNASIGWYAYTRQFIAPSSGAGPVMQDPARPYVSNDDFRVTGKQPTAEVADLSNPILQPWARDVIRRRNELVLAGKEVYTPHAACWPVGVPGFILRPMTQAMYIIQAPKEVVMILASKVEVRHIFLTDHHTPNLKPSWYGESIGHYEGASLVVDTIGINDKTWVDGFATPHTSQLHVIERFHLISDGQELQADVHVEDPGAFTMPWNAIQRFRQYEWAVHHMSIERATQLASVPEGPITEQVCADNPNSFFSGTVSMPLPVANVPDF
jgi:hypothetical protein